MSVMEDTEDDPRDSESIYANPWIAEYKRRQAMLREMRPSEVIAMMRDLNPTSYAFSKNGEELQAHIWRYPEIGQSQPFNPDVGDSFGVELARLLANFLASVKSLVSDRGLFYATSGRRSESNSPSSRATSTPRSDLRCSKQKRQNSLRSFATIRNTSSCPT